MTDRIFTVGHSTHPVDDFTALLKAHGVEQVVDVRTVPTSRHNPQFWRDALDKSLRAEGIQYTWLQALGGLRHASKDSPNTGWRNTSFRGYADYMMTDAFTDGLEKLLALSADTATAIMCAEAVPWRCHRSLIGDALLVRGVEVLDIMSPTQAKPHTLTSFAQVDGLRITYPPE